MKTMVQEAVPLICLVGPPNSGKTTLFNALSGKNFKTVNYPGATVEYSISNFSPKLGLKANVLDSPGIVSLLPNSPDEKVSVEAMYNHPTFGIPDVVIATADASQLARHLFLVKQLIKSDFKVIVAITMVDLLNKKGNNISLEKLSEELNCDVVAVDGRSGKGIKELIALVTKNLAEVKLLGKKKPTPFQDYPDIRRMIDSYKDIEAIEQKVVYEIPGANGFDIDVINKQLTVIDAPNIKKVTNKPDLATLKIDNFLLHRVWGLLAFFFIMSLTFTSIFWLADPLMGMIDDFFAFLSEAAAATMGTGWFSDLISNGIINGAGSVLVFVPQIIILFLILGVLEDTGYLARGAMLVDKPLSKIGLNGKSFVPMLSGFACAIPAMMAARTIANKRERILTIFILPLMSCSARLPVFALLIAFLLPSDKLWLGGIILASIYIFSVTSSIAIAGIMNKFKHRLVKETDNSSFILELPAYRVPSIKAIFRNTYSNTVMYLSKAGPVIIIFAIALWFLTYFPNHSPVVEERGLTEAEVTGLIESERLGGSYAAGLGKIIQPIMTPIGMDWRVGVSLISAFAAREVFVSSMALIFKVTSDDDEESMQASLLNAMRNAEIEETGEKLFTASTIVGLIIFFIFAMQCLSTVAVSKKETGGWRIPILQLIVFTGLAYALTFLTVNGMRLIGFA
jgi:ferrous iron transport protein B